MPSVGIQNPQCERITKMPLWNNTIEMDPAWKLLRVRGRTSD
jgi:hypothetical protein